jgi:hypothetical protein
VGNTKGMHERSNHHSHHLYTLVCGNDVRVVQFRGFLPMRKPAGFLTPTPLRGTSPVGRSSRRASQLAEAFSKLHFGCWLLRGYEK